MVPIPELPTADIFKYISVDLLVILKVTQIRLKFDCFVSNVNSIGQLYDSFFHLST